MEVSADHKSLYDQILVVALRLFIAYGFHGLSMRQIAEAVGVSKAALYYHFQDKEQLFLAVLDTQLEHFEALINQVLIEELDTRQRIRRLVIDILSQPMEMRAALRLASQEMAQLGEPARTAFIHSYHTRFIDKIQVILKMGIDQGELRNIDDKVATWALLGILYPYLFPSRTGELPPARTVVEPLLLIFLDGIARPNT